jgi:hypothetical protein
MTYYENYDKIKMEEEFKKMQGNEVFCYKRFLDINPEGNIQDTCLLKDKKNLIKKMEKGFYILKCPNNNKNFSCLSCYNNIISDNLEELENYINNNYYLEQSPVLLEQKDIVINAFNFNNYLENNPVIQACVESWKKVMPEAKIKLWTLDEVKDIAEKYNFSKIAMANDDLGSYIGDPVRIYLATHNKYFLYLDLDTFILKDLAPLCNTYENFTISHYNFGNNLALFINNGAIFWSSNYGKGFWEFLSNKYNELDKTIKTRQDVFDNDICSWTEKLFINEKEYPTNCKFFNDEEILVNKKEDTLKSYISHAGSSIFLYREKQKDYKNFNDEIYYTDLPFPMYKEKLRGTDIKSLFFISAANGYQQVDNEINVLCKNVIFPQKMTFAERSDLFVKQIKKLYNKEPIFIPASFFLREPKIKFHIPNNNLSQQRYLSSRYPSSTIIVDNNDKEKIDIKLTNEKKINYYLPIDFYLLEDAVVDIYLADNTVIYDDIYVVVNDFFKDKNSVRTTNFNDFCKIDKTTINIVCCKKDLNEAITTTKKLLDLNNVVNIHYNENEEIEDFDIFKNNKNFTFNYGKNSIYSARKKMLKNVKTDYCIFIDPDDDFLPLKNINDYIRQGSDLITLNYIDKRHSKMLSKHKLYNWSGLWNKIVKTEKIKEAYNYIDDLPQIYEDKIIYLILLMLCKGFVYIADNLQQLNYIYYPNAWLDNNLIYKRKDEIIFTLKEINKINNKKMKEYIAFEIMVLILQSLNILYKQEKINLNRLFKQSFDFKNFIQEFIDTFSLFMDRKEVITTFMFALNENNLSSEIKYLCEEYNKEEILAPFEGFPFETNNFKKKFIEFDLDKIYF